MDKNTLQMVGEWAKSRVASGEEPPWTFHKLKQLAEIASELASGMEAVTYVEVDGASTQIQKSANIVQLENFRPQKTAPSVPLPA